MPEPRRSITVRALDWLAKSIFSHRAWWGWPHLFLCIAAILLTVKFLGFLTSRNDLVGGDKEYHRAYLEYKNEFQVADELVVVVESDYLEKNRQFVERLGAKLEAETNLFAGVFYKGDLKSMGRKALLFLPENNLRDLGKTFQEYRPMLMKFTQVTNLVSLFNLINRQFRTAVRQPRSETEALAKALPALERIVTQATDALNRLGNPPSPGVNSFFEGGKEAESQMYITFASNRIYLVTANAPTEELAPESVKRLRQLVHETQVEVPGVNVGLTGEPVLEVDEMAQSAKDTMLASIVSLAVVALIFIYGYHETGRPLKATLCLLVGLGYTMGFTTLAVGHLNILTITFVPILIGLAIDFGVHLISRYEEELREGRSEAYALEKGIVFTGLGIFTGAFTTAGAFFAMAFTDFKGIQEMGIICGGGMLVCLVPMLTLLPVLLLRGEQNVLDHELGPVLHRKELRSVNRRARLESLWLERPVIVGIITLGISALAVVYAREVKFDYNLLNMQSKGLPAVVYQDKLIQSSQRSVLSAAVIADSLSHATNLITQITNLPSVAYVQSMAEYLTEDQSGKLKALSQVKEMTRDIEFHPVDRNPLNVTNLVLSLFSLHGYLGLAVPEARKEDPAIALQLTSLRDAILKLIHLIRVDDPEFVSRKLAVFQQALFTDLSDTFGSIRNQDDSGPLRVQDLPEIVRKRFIGIHGKVLLQVYPKQDVWAREAQEQFVRELRTVDSMVTGTPVQLYEYTTLLKQSFQEAALYSLIAIAVLVFIHFRSLSCVILSLLPVGFGFLWMLGIMGYYGIPFNPANVMTLPLIVGIGVTNGIHILNRFAEEQHPSILALSTGKAVLISGLTTIAGFGSLILAQHRGIRSLGLIMSIGVTTCMLVGLTFLPALLNLLSRYGWTIKKTQRDNAQSTLGREEPR